MPSNLKPALAILRYALSAFLAVWVVEKFLHPETTVAIWKHFYLVEAMPEVGSYVIGAIQAVALLGFVLGVAKFWSYGFWFVTHSLGTVLSYKQLLNPYDSVNHLFWAAVPVAAAFLLLFLLRREDTLGTLGK